MKSIARSEGRDVAVEMILGLRPATEKHSVPVIDRMMEVLTELERRVEGASITDLTATLGQPRSSIYRILNTLERHQMVRRDGAGTYVLGARLLSLAAHVASGASNKELPEVAQPVLNRLAEVLGEGIKLTVVDGHGLLVIAAAQGRREYALNVRPGQRLPLHVGAAGKVLLAHLPEAERRRSLEGDLGTGAGGRSLTAGELERELERVRAQGWARDRGDQATSIHAVAVPVTEASGRVVAALSVPFLAGADEARVEEIRMAALEAGSQLSASLKEA